MNKIRNKKGALDISFGWIFAVLVGAFIIFLAIYGVVKFVNMQKNYVSSEGARSIGILTNPLETSFESGKRAMIVTGAETRIYTNCSNASTFGKQLIATSERSYNRWGEDPLETSFQNKYIFSKNPVDGKKFYVFSKPLNFPFKVGDLMYLTSATDKYCFVKPPHNIEEEISDLRGGSISKDENFFLVNTKSQCGTGNITVCFNGEIGCNVLVSMSSKMVKKRNEAVWFEGDALMYAAIFSNKADYECQVDRLMNRTEQLFQIYSNKSKFILQKTGCNTELDVELIQMLALIKGFQDSEDLSVIYDLADDMGKKNEYAECKLW
jgi:hypothetical protein